MWDFDDFIVKSSKFCFLFFERPVFFVSSPGSWCACVFCSETSRVPGWGTSSRYRTPTFVPNRQWPHQSRSLGSREGRGWVLYWPSKKNPLLTSWPVAPFSYMTLLSLTHSQTWVLWLTTKSEGRMGSGTRGTSDPRGSGEMIEDVGYVSSVSYVRATCPRKELTPFRVRGVSPFLPNSLTFTN